jgi:hypothetical protein
MGVVVKELEKGCANGMRRRGRRVFFSFQEVESARLPGVDMGCPSKERAKLDKYEATHTHTQGKSKRNLHVRALLHDCGNTVPVRWQCRRSRKTTQRGLYNDHRNGFFLSQTQTKVDAHCGGCG